jgi:hypothetical protein
MEHLGNQNVWCLSRSNSSIEYNINHSRITHRLIYWNKKRLEIPASKLRYGPGPVGK